MNTTRIKSAVEISMGKACAGHICVDLDGTLVDSHDWQGPTYVGRPIPAMVERVKRWLESGIEVRIFTARVCQWPDGTKDLGAVYVAIEDWCEKHLGQKLRITCSKDYQTVEYWDDRAVQVERDTGRRVDGKPDRY